MRSIRPGEPLIPSSSDAEMARRLISRLPGPEVALSVGDEREPAPLPPAIAALVLRLLEHMAAGEGVALLPIDRELTTQEAADLLGVSRPFLVGRLDAGEIPFRKVGAHRRVRVRDLLEYRRRMDAASAEALDELAAEAQRLGLGY